ncbi:M14 family metallopeptidase [Dokdonella sp.]|uniref:M14 family metallopeptidase n=1 Tax=Dokdonella sp. TaxID=2291710 RepID=UPI003527B571
MTQARLFAVLLTCVSATSFAAGPDLETTAQKSGFKRTGHYNEVIRLCADFAKAYPDAVRCFEFGKSPQGRPMMALAVSRSGALSATAAHERDLPVMLVQGGIHAGEIDGKDAGFLALREALDGRAAKGSLDKQVIVFVPVFNVDGHERFKAWNRPNQRGPEEMGWRTTAQNLNLNRDYMKADAPEMQAMLALMNEWDPLVLADLHVTDGAKFEHDISINIEPLYSGDGELRKAGLALRTDLVGMLARQGSLPLPFYPSFVVYDDPASGFEDNSAAPRFSHGYMPLRNRFGVLVETHSWKDYPTRVQGTRNTIVDLLELVAAHGKQWLTLADAADQRATQLGGSSLPLSYKATDKSRIVEFRGYAYTRTPSEISGTLMTRYDESKPAIWKIPLRDDVQPDIRVDAPKGGYIVPSAHAEWVGAKLALHGIAYRTIASAQSSASVQTFRASKTKFDANPFENHQRVGFEGEWKDEPMDIAAGALFVPISQPRARLVVALLEPKAPDSLAAWGEFNAAFEQKEYMEMYVAEEVARDMLEQDPAVAAEFNRKLDSDPEFARDPFARLAFFARRHESWDDRFNLYPVMRSAKAF